MQSADLVGSRFGRLHPMTRVATANVLHKLPADAARTALELVLAEEPDLVALQEWYVTRAPLLRPSGDVRLVPSLGLLHLPGGPAYHWIATLGAGCVVGARADRYDVLDGRALVLSRLGTSERTDHPLNAEPPRIAAIGTFRDRRTHRTTSLMSYHFVVGAEKDGTYRADRPRLTARHRQELARANRALGHLQRAGHEVHAAGDANFHLLRLPGLTSAWEGREDEPGTIGRGKRKIDDVHGHGPAREVRLLQTPSDHRALLVTRPD